MRRKKVLKVCKNKELRKRKDSQWKESQKGHIQKEGKKKMKIVIVKFIAQLPSTDLHPNTLQKKEKLEITKILFVLVKLFGQTFVEMQNV